MTSASAFYHTYRPEDAHGRMHNTVVPMLAGNLKGKPRSYRVQWIRQGDCRHACGGTGNKFVRVLDRQVRA